MNIIVNLLIFCVVLFLYLHVHFHLKTSNDLEVYEIEQPSKDKLEEICDLRQPVIFQFLNERLLESCTLNNLNKLYGAFDIQLRDIANEDQTAEMYLPFILKEAVDGFHNDNEGKVISEKNIDFLEETGAIKNFRYNDEFLRPPLLSKCIYDFMVGSSKSSTPLRYNLNYRNYYYVTNGNINIKLIPPYYGKYLNYINDYDNFEFRSPINVWNVQDKYKAEFDKVKSLEVELKKGQIIFIPPYWWYSIQYNNMANICSFQYRTFMNSLAISPQICMSLLQNQNIKRDIVEKIPFIQEKKELGEKNEDEILNIAPKNEIETE